MKNMRSILGRIIYEVKNGTNFVVSINNNCETKDDKDYLIRYIGYMVLNRSYVEVFSKSWNIRKMGFRNIEDLQSFVYMYIWNNPEINRL